MLARITGILETVERTTALVAPPPMGDGGVPPGVAYEILVPAYLAERLASRVGETITFHTIQYLESQAQGASFIPRLVGFGSARERRFFELFTTVKGIGNRKALRAMAVPVGELARAIASRDARALKALPEIGQRLAETIIAELHGKIDEFAPGADGAAVAPDGPIIEGKSGPGPASSPATRQAEDALVRLGETRQSAAELIRRAAERVEAAATADELLAAAFALR